MAEAEQKINGNDMTMDAQIALRAPATQGADAPLTYSAAQLQLLKDTIAKGSSDLEFEIFIEVAKAKRLDPLKKQIHFVKRWDSELGRYVWTPQTGIDGYRLIADRTGSYAPGSETRYDYDKDGKLVSATAFVKKWVRGEWHPISATAFYDEYVQFKKDGSPTSMWRQRPRLMLAKCAEALALRKAFPDELSGLYTHEEMAQAQIEAGSIPAQIEASVVSSLPAAGMITTDQKRRLKKLTDDLLAFDIPAAALQKKMAADFNVERSAELTEEQADKFTADLFDWLNSLEESRAANLAADEPVKKVEVPF
jgi:phage recombination protein Bet